MAVINGAPLLLREKAAGGYQIERSVRFASEDSAYMSWTPSETQTGGRKTYTISFWFKLGTPHEKQVLFSAGDGGSRTYLYVSDNLYLGFDGGGQGIRRTNINIVDPTAWYHFVLQYDDTHGTAQNRAIFWLNGVDCNEMGEGWNLNYGVSQNWGETQFTQNGQAHWIGKNTEVGAAGEYWDGYIADMYMIDGESHPASKFGEFNDAGIWNPIEPTGLTYGNNGFHLDFKTSTLGNDVSGNDNDFTTHNFSTSAGSGNDWSYDSPTNILPTGGDTGAGGTVTGNYSVMNPWASLGSTTFNQGNLKVTSNGSNGCTVATMMPTSGKWYAEVKPLGNHNENAVGVGLREIHHETDWPGEGGHSIGWHANTGNVMMANNNVSTGNTWEANNTLGVAWDVDTGKVWFRKNGDWIGSGNPAGDSNESGQIGTALRGRPMTLIWRGIGSTSAEFNFGARPFTNAAPSGFKCLCSANLEDPPGDANTYHDIVRYLHSTDPTGMKMQPDKVSIKCDTHQSQWACFDALRGVHNRLSYNSNTDVQAESTTLTSFDSDGFSVGENDNVGATNKGYTAFCWSTGSETGSSSSVATGKTGQTRDVTSSKSSSAFGFEIVKYTGDGGSTTKYGHNLGKKPTFGFFKKYSGSGDWKVFHHYMGVNNMVTMNENWAQGAASWDMDEATDGVFQPCRSGDTYLNGNGDTYSGYLFTDVDGLFATGMYTGNGEGAHAAFQNCGFRPRTVFIKSNSHNEKPHLVHWRNFSANIVSGTNNEQYGNRMKMNFAVQSDNKVNNSDISWYNTATGFGRHSQVNGNNSAGKSYIWAAWAAEPFKFARAH